VSHVVRDGEVVEIGTVQVRVLAVPGHTAGSAAYLADSCLFIGDSANVTSWGELVGAPWPLTDDSARNRASIKALAGKLSDQQDSIAAILPSHSGVVDYSALKRFVP
jgi:glyoxylase-like metal-dependent hydrolase (beta-lactamase superfamily II)